MIARVTNSIVMLTQEASFNVEPPHKDTSFLGMTIPAVVMSRHKTSFNVEPPHKDTSFLGMTIPAVVMLTQEASFNVEPPHKDTQWLDTTTAVSIYFVKLFDGVGYSISRLVITEQ